MCGKKGAFAWEYKKAGEDLDRAYQQLLQYRESLENPPLLVVSDLQTIHVHTNFPNTVKQVYSWTLDDLLDPRRLDELRRVWTDPFAFRAPQTTEQVTEAAAREFARLADGLRRQGAEPPAAAHFLIRLLFCLFAEDVALLPSGLLSRLIARTRSRPEVFTQQLRQLFGAMATGGWFGTDEIAHFSGGLFDDDAVLPLDRDGMDILAGICALDWSSI